jgi:hypothetical protein
MNILSYVEYYVDYAIKYKVMRQMAHGKMFTKGKPIQPHLLRRPGNGQRKL